MINAKKAKLDQEPTLRDQVAMAALQGLLTNPNRLPEIEKFDMAQTYIRAALWYADEYMKEKERSNG